MYTLEKSLVFFRVAPVYFCEFGIKRHVHTLPQIFNSSVLQEVSYFIFLNSCKPEMKPIPNNKVINPAKYGISSVIFLSVYEL